ncbi:mechanosensitive ion channel family protein [Kushneria aurantia]|uniref:Mechanosensitive ion channel family protein n=1 Tax=Kushneria aurantia TaxID=504092 RepID=A0ABV6FYG6_9GAMM|nr:mechanosensitive ion channel family protein [Kushneria aurantia]
MNSTDTGLPPIEELQQRYDGLLTLPGWLWIALTTLLLALLLDASLHFIFGRLEKRFNRSSHRWDDALIFGVRRPFRLWVWLTVISVLASLIGEAFTIDPINQHVALAQSLATLFCMGWAGLRLIVRLEKRLVFPPASSRARSVDPTSASAITKSVGALILTVLVLMALQLMGFSISSLLALGGFGGLVIGFAVRDLIANFFSGMVIYIDKPFVVGDWIKSPERDIEGVVEDIGWRLTTIRTFAGPPIYVPNMIFNQIVVENPTRMYSRRLWERISIDYGDRKRVRPITSAIRQYLREHHQIDQQELITVNFVTYGDHALELMVYAFTVPTDWQTFQELKEDILIRAGEIVEEHGATLALPISRLRLQESALTLREERHAEEDAPPRRRPLGTGTPAGKTAGDAAPTSRSPGPDADGG